MSAIKFYLTGRTGTREVSPLKTKNLDITWSKQDTRSEMVKSLSGEMLFAGDDFYWLLILEKLTYRCDPLILEIKKKCNVDFETIYKGNVSLNSGSPWNLDKGIVSLKVKETNKYQCFEDSKDIDLDLFALIPARKSVSYVIGTVEYHIVTDINPVGAFDRFPGEPDPSLKGWIQQSETRKTIGGDINYTAIWARENAGIVLPASGTWILDGADYVRTVFLYGYRTDPMDGNNPDDYGWYNNIFNFQIDNGLDLYEVLAMLVSYACPDLQLQSDFFQWSPVTATNINYATGATSKVLNLYLFQKSDVKRPGATNNASKFMTNLGKLLQDICNEFQLEWEITDDLKFKIEHVSFKNRDQGIDTTPNPLNVGKRTYTYDNDNIPRKENFTPMEGSPGDFLGTSIVYQGSCANNGENKEKTFAIENITTDIILCLNNPDPDSAVSDDGAVLVATDIDGIIMNEAPILGGNALNNTLGLAMLQRDYYRHNRPQKEMVMNQVKQLALSVKPTKLQENILYNLCCGDEDFNPDELIKTSLGDNGILKAAKLNIMTELLEVAVLFPSDDNLISNRAPEAAPDAFSTYKNTVLVFDILANDIDLDGNIDPSSIEILVAPLNGTAQIGNDYKIVYTPNLDFVGTEYIAYGVKDKFGEPSLNSYAIITVAEGSPLPIANSDTYQMATNRTLIVAANGVLNNDVSAGSLSVLYELKATPAGGSIELFANGAFEYTPPVDFVGIDEPIPYTAIDAGNQSDGAIKIIVSAAESVYVKFQAGNFKNKSIITYCPGRGQSLVGEQRTARFKLSFFSDVDKTIPLNISGYGLAFNIRALQTNNNDNTVIGDSTTPFVVLSGTEAIYQDEQLTEYQFYGCENDRTDNYSIELSLQAGTGYNI